MKVVSRTPQKVFLTGGAGFLGRALVERLLAEGYEVVALVRRAQHPAHLKQPGVHLISGDVRDEASLAEALAGVDYAIHAAAAFGGSWEDFHAVNVRSTQILLDLSVKHRLRCFVYISSVSVYAHHGHGHAHVFTEDAPFEQEEHASFYAKSKIAAENVVWECIKAGKVPCVIFRPGAIYGPHGHVFPATLGLGMGEEKIILMGDSHSTLPLSYVENVAEAVVRSLQLDSAAGECFNLTEDETLSRRNYVKLIARDVNPSLRVLHAPLWFMGLMKFVLKQAFGLIGKKAPLSALNLKLYCSSMKYSNEKFKRVFGATPFVGFQESLARTIKWQKEKRTPKRSYGLENGKVVIPSQRKLRVGVIGCGNISAVHLGIIKESPHIAEIAIADPKEQARRSMAARFGITRHYADYRELIQKEKPEAVHILTPPQFHAPIAKFSVQNGCHVLVEKPMAVDAKEAQEIAQAAKEHGVKLCAVHNHLYDRVMLQAREILARGLLGRLTFVESWYGTQFSGGLPFDPKNHWGVHLPGPIYQDFMPHALYVLTDFMPKPRVKEVLTSCSGNIPGIDHDELKVILQNEQTLGMIHLSLSVSPRYQFLNVFGTAGSMKLDFLNKVVLLDKEINAMPRMLNRSLLALQHGRILRRAGWRNSLKMFKSEKFLFEGTERLIGLFYRSVLLNEPEPVTASEGLETMQIMDQIWAKMKAPTHSIQGDILGCSRSFSDSQRSTLPNLNVTVD
ncbi:MAG: NAD-dependent epimerase/dehydratase family protein [bacterium]